MIEISQKRRVSMIQFGQVLNALLSFTPKLVHSSGIATILVAVFFLSFSASEVSADVFKLKDGRRIEGTLLRKSSVFWTVRTSEGKLITLEPEEIKLHEVVESNFDIYLKKAGKVPAADVPGNLELARWCLDSSRKLYKEAVKHLRYVLREEPSHLHARTLLGYEKIAGEWYIAGSIAAQAAREIALKPKKDPLAEGNSEEEWGEIVAKPGEMDDNLFDDSAVGKRGKTPSPKKVEYRAGADSVSLKLTDRAYKKKGEKSYIQNAVAYFMHKLDKPMSLSTSENAPYSLDLKIQVNFVRTHMFYGSIPVSHIFQAKLSFVLKNSEGRSVARFTSLKVPYSASARRDKADVERACYFYATDVLLHHLSKHKFFKDRGAKLIESPE